MPGPRDVPDPADIITEPRKHKVPAHLNDTNNTSTDPTLKHLRKGGLTAQQTETLVSQASTSHSQSPVIKIQDDEEDEIPATNQPPRDPRNILESSNDNKDARDEERLHHTQRLRQPSRKRSRVVLGSDDEAEEDEPVPPPPKKKKDKATAQLHEEEEAVPEQLEEDAEAMLDRLISTWNSPIYAFFEPRPTINTHHDSQCLEFKCGAPQCKGQGNQKERRIVRRYLDAKLLKDGKAKVDNSTGNLYKHARKCWGLDIVQQAINANDLAVTQQALAASKTLADGSITATFERTGKGKVTYSTKPLTYQETRVESVRWVTESMRPASIVGDRGYHKLMKTGRPHMKLPSPQTVSCDVHVIFKNVRACIAELLKNYDGRLNFATDAWTSPNHRPFIAVTVHMEKNGEPLCMLLDIVELSVSHSGVNLAAAFVDILRSYGIEHKLLSVTCNNASSNDTMINEIAKLILSYPGAVNRVRCLAHVVNLVVKIILWQFNSRRRVKTSEKASKGVKSGQKGESDGEVASDESQVPEDDPLDLGEIADDIEREEKEMDEVVDESEDEELGEDEVEWFEEALGGKVDEVAASTQPARLVLTKLRKLAYAIKNSPTIILPRWKAAILEVASEEPEKDRKLMFRMMLRDVPTRWNSSYDMLKLSYLYWCAIDRLTSRRDLGVRKYELTDDEWVIVKQLRDTLKVFKNTTLKFSSKSTNLPDVIPAMDQMHDALTSSMKDPKLNASIRSALSLGIDLLNKYYSLTDESEVYRIAIVLHPSYKLRYFKKAGWDKDWMKTAEDIIRNEFKRVYADFKLLSQASHLTNLRKPAKHSSSLPDSDDDINIPVSSEGSSSSDDEEMISELDRYLKAKTVKGVEAPLARWYENRGSYPRLWRMARDYLTIPATSVSVECVFSKGRLIISHIQNRLSGQSTRALLCLGAWTKQNLVKNSDLIEASKLPEVDDNEESVVVDYPIV
ncbi:hypothetical protein EST38_g11056 [Candolleomyces aberdarensis]|uniref:HAT C-terminal dimerisation domain-containing protein n=1 Tax=Candolleomyces aberdarensis TaxID=2316362 RepID=A0A4Q2D5U2_9AGAR|nr:hypothetical protein EST38_g11056 [Candolleomyces aberdarensis]